MAPQLPPGQGPIDPYGAFAPPSPPQNYGPPQPPPPHPGMAPQPQRRGGTGRTILVTLLVLMLVGSFGLNLLLVAILGFAGGSSDHIVTTTVEEGDSSDEVAVIPLSGEIDDDAARRIDRCLNRIKDEKDVKAVVLEIDSPGGTVTAADEIYKRVRRYKDDRAAKGWPSHVVVSMRSMATSGGYYAACAGDFIYAEPTTLTGNIGVLLPRYNFSGLMEKYGVEETTVVSSGSKYKNAGSPFKPENAQDTQYLQALADSAMTQFKKVVTEGRGAKLVGKKEDLFSGRVFVATEAKTAGLIDDVGYPHDAYAHAAKLANVSKPTIVRYEEPNPSLLGLLTQGHLPARKTGGGININGIDVSARPESLDALRTHRLMYR